MYIFALNLLWERNICVMFSVWLWKCYFIYLHQLKCSLTKVISGCRPLWRTLCPKICVVRYFYGSCAALYGAKMGYSRRYTIDISEANYTEMIKARMQVQEINVDFVFLIIVIYQIKCMNLFDEMLWIYCKTI